MSRSRTAGITLIEVMVVVVILGLATSAMSLGLGALGRTQIRSACNRLMAATQFSYNRAIIQGTTVRMVFTLPADKFSVEEAHGRITLQHGDADPRAKEPSSGAVDPWAAAQARVQDTFSPNMNTSPFGPLTGPTGGVLKRYSNVQVADGVRIVRLYVSHETGPLEEGEAAIHFFPGGRTQHAVVHVADRNDNVFAVEIHPLTGRAKVHTEAYVPRSLLDDGSDPETEVMDR